MSFWERIRRSSPSTLNSVPAYLAYRTLSPMATSIASRDPSSRILPGPTDRTSPSWGFSFAVSGKTMPLFVISSRGVGLMTTRSPSGRSLVEAAVAVANGAFLLDGTGRPSGIDVETSARSRRAARVVSPGSGGSADFAARWHSHVESANTLANAVHRCQPESRRRDAFLSRSGRGRGAPCRRHQLALSEAEEARLVRPDLVEVDVVETGLLEGADLFEHRLKVGAARDH